MISLKNQQDKLVSAVARLNKEETELTGAKVTVPTPAQEQTINPVMPNNSYNCYYQGGLTPEDMSALKREFCSAGVKVVQERQITEEMREREAIKREAHRQKLIDTEMIRQQSDELRSLKSFDVFIEFGKVVGAFRKQDGVSPSRKVLIDEELVSVKKLFSYSPKKHEYIVLQFSKFGRCVEVVYNAETVRNGSCSIIKILRAHGIDVRVPRRLKAEIEDGLTYLFETTAEKELIPFTLGYYQDADGVWHYAKPGSKTLTGMIKEEANGRY